MKLKKLLALALAVCMIAAVAAGCGGGSSSASTAGSTAPSTSTPAASGDGLNLAVNLASEPNSIDPALNNAVDGAIMLHHFFEGLMTWKNGSDASEQMGDAVLTEGQAESYEKVENEDGTVTYTFKLREGIKWSDGQAVTAGDFVYAWQRLVDPATAAEYGYMADMLVNYNEIANSEKEPSELGVEATDDSTLVVTLTYDCPYFLEIAAFPALFPVRQDIIESAGDQWTFEVETYIGNGPYKMQEWAHNSFINTVKNEEYYGYEDLGPESIKYVLMDDQNAMLTSFNSGELDFINEMPVDEIPALLDSGELHIQDYIGTYMVAYNVEAAPFDDPLVRHAFNLVIDRNYIVEQITQTGQVAAPAYVPSGIYDAAGATGDDFRTVGGDYYSVADEDYEANCEKARELLAEAGYPDGAGFPAVEYMYNTSDNHKAIGEALQNMWQTELGVSVTLANQDWAVFQETRQNGDYQIARHGWIGDYNDPITFLDMWDTKAIGGNNVSQYSNLEFDAKIAEAKATSVAEERMEAMHAAEDILMEDMPIAPIYFYTNKYMMNPEVKGAFYTPLGYYFFSHCTN